MSVVEPAGTGTRKRIGRDGNNATEPPVADCAWFGTITNHTQNATTMYLICNNFYPGRW